MDGRSSCEREYEPVQTSVASIYAGMKSLEMKSIVRPVRFVRTYPSTGSSTPRRTSHVGSCVDLQSVEVVMRLK